MRTYSAAALAALEAGTAISVGATKVAASTPFMVWGGSGTITLGGDNYLGINDRGLIEVSAGALGDSAQSIKMTLSGVDPDTVSLLNASSIQRSAVAIWRLLFDSSGTVLLDSQVYSRGRLDTLGVTETVGGTSTLEVNVETAAVALGRAGQRMRSDADQRLIDAADGGFRAVSYAGVKQLYWGGKPPSTARNALPGGGGGSRSYGDRQNIRDN